FDLLQRERGVLRRIQRALAHDLVDHEPELRPELRDVDRTGPFTPAVVLDQFRGVAGGILSAFDRNVPHARVLSVGVPADTGGSWNTEEARFFRSLVVARDDRVDAEREFGVACLQGEKEIGIERTNVDGPTPLDSRTRKRQLEAAGDRFVR